MRGAHGARHDQRAAAMERRLDGVAGSAPMLARIALVIASMLITLFVVELGARLVRGPEWLWSWHNLVLRERSMAGTRDGRFVYDAQLGFISAPDFKSP